MNTLTAATIIRTIFNQKVGSVLSDFALVINSKMPEGIISHNPLLDHGSRWRDIPHKGRFREKPRSRMSNINAAPTSMTIPTICTISRAGYNQSDWRIPAAQLVFSSQSATRATSKNTLS